MTLTDRTASSLQAGGRGFESPSSTCENDPEQIVMPCGDSSTICARRQVTTDPSPFGLSAAAAALALIDLTNL